MDLEWRAARSTCGKDGVQSKPTNGYGVKIQGLRGDRVFVVLSLKIEEGQSPPACLTGLGLSRRLRPDGRIKR